MRATLFCAASAAALLTAAGAEARDVALVIGNSAYASENALGSPGRDAAAVAARLEGLGFDVEIETDLSRAALYRALQEFSREAEDAETALVYYGGHGMEIGGVNYLIPVDATLDREGDAEFEAVPLARARSALAGAERLQVLIVDACRDNRFNLANAAGQSTMGGAVRSLRPQPARRGEVIVFSTQGGAVARDGGDTGLSPFAQAFTETLDTAPELDIRVLFTSLGPRVAELAGEPQRPEVVFNADMPARTVSLGTSQAGQGVSPPPSPTPPPPVDEVDEAEIEARGAFNFAQTVNTISAWEAFLSAHDRSRYAADARTALASLRAAQTPPPEPVIDPAAQIREAQRLLAAMGYYVGSVDGIAGGRTDAAVAAFRAARGVSGAGIDDALLVALRQAERAGHRAPTPPQPSGPAPGEVFTDALRGGGRGPEMVVIPAGSFTMGSPASEEGRGSDEGPQRTVRIARPFAASRTEVTRGEFARFVDATGYDAGNRCRTFEGGSWGWRDGLSWRNPGFSQTDAHPVVCVDWDAATAYAAWLRRETGESYRLLSEAEWEYAARAGTTGRFSNDGGERALCAIANGSDQTHGQSWSNTACSDGYGGQTAPVGSFSANSFGLYDMHGNVWEWVQDCWNDSYAGAPADGRAWESGDCSRRVLRGGSWFYSPLSLRSANRDRNAADYPLYFLGFRVARTL